MKPSLALILVIDLATLGSSQVFAEGVCPPGMYPVGGQGVQGCAPIHGALGGGAGFSVPAPAPPRPTGAWITTWGADDWTGGGGLHHHPTVRLGKLV